MRTLLLLLLACLSLGCPAQTGKKAKGAAAVKTTRTATAKTTQKTGQQKKAGTSTATTSISKLKSQQATTQRQLQEQRRRLQENERKVKERLQTLMMLNNEIADKQKVLDTIRHDIGQLDGSIAVLEQQLDSLQTQLDDRKQRYRQSMQYMHRNRSVQSKLMFVFGAQNFRQMYRRMRFSREYAGYQRAQGEAVQLKQAEVTQKHDELVDAKQQKTTLLNRSEQERRQLEGKQTEQKEVVSSLQKEQKTIQKLITDHQKKLTELNGQIDRLVAQEAERARKRAEAEARQKEAQAAAKKREAELARKKAAAEAAAKENARRVAEAKAKEEKAKAAARAASRKSAAEKEAAQRAAREAENARKAAERDAKAAERARKKEMAEAKRASEESFKVSSSDRKLNGNFESNRGRLPMPITGGYRIVSRFGQNNVAGTRNVILNNKGITLLGQAGAQACCVFDGEVSAIALYGGGYVVMVRHGSYISFYSNIVAPAVRQGQKVSARQVLGRLADDHLMEFQLRHIRQMEPLNPERWLGR